MRTSHLALKVKCEECENLFSRNDKINNHMKLVHNQVPEYIKQKKHLTNDMRTFHLGLKVKCEECDKLLSKMTN